jgi:hypothetical protein
MTELGLVTDFQSFITKIKAAKWHSKHKAKTPEIYIICVAAMNPNLIREQSTSITHATAANHTTPKPHMQP